MSSGFGRGLWRHLARRGLWWADVPFVLSWYVAPRLWRLGDEVDVVKAVMRLSVRHTGDARFPFRHPLWVLGSWWVVRRDVQAWRLRQRRVLHRHLGRRALYAAQGVADDIGQRWADERLVRDLRRIGEDETANWIALAAFPERPLSSRAERAPASVGGADGQDPHLSSTDSRGRNGT